MLQIKNLTITLKKDLRTLVSDFSFTLNAGDKAVIIGEEGNGKSTLLKLIYDPQLVAGYVEYSGEIITQKTRFGYLSQDLSDMEKAMTVLEFFSAVPNFYDMTPRELSDILRPLGLSREMLFSDQRMGSMSGGERVKLQLARTIIGRPEALLLDEPSNDIDIAALEWLESFINTCVLPIVFVSHDEVLIENTANVIIHLEQVRRKTVPRCTVAHMTYGRYIGERMARLERQEQEARNERGAYEAKMERYTQIRQKVEYRQDTISRGDPHGGQLLKKKMKAVKSMGRRFERERLDMMEAPDVEDAIFVKFDAGISIPNGKTIIDFRLDKLSIGERLLAQNIALTVVGPEKIGIIGRNGIGKTTLLKRIAGELMNRADIKCAYMPQDYGDILEDTATPVGFLAERGEKTEMTRARTLLGSMRYTADEMEHSVSQLSGGQKAKLLLLKMITGGNNVLVLDEPTRNFSPLSNPVIREILSSFGGAIISVSHDRKYISEVCTKVYRLSETGLEIESEEFNNESTAR